MDKHERVADEIVDYIVGGEIGAGSTTELAFARKQLAAILRREYSDERNADRSREAALESLLREARDFLLTTNVFPFPHIMDEADRVIASIDAALKEDHGSD